MKRSRLGCLMKGIFDFLSLLVHDNDGRRNGLIERRVWLYQRHIISFSSFSLFLLPPKNSIWHLCDLKFFMQKKRIIRRCPGESWKINFIKNDFPFFVSFSLVLWLNTEKSGFFLTCVGNRWDVQTHFHLQTLCGTTTMVQCLWTLGLIMQQGMIVRISLSFVGSLVEWRVGGAWVLTSMKAPANTTEWQAPESPHQNAQLAFAWHYSGFVNSPFNSNVNTIKNPDINKSF